jgi:hypothetical protein
VVLDGVQAELHVNPSSCRQTLGANVAAAFMLLAQQLKTMPDVAIEFKPVVKVSKKEFDSLKPESKLLGCAPSLNYYDKDAKIDIDMTSYKTRSAGGHLHLGLHAAIRKYRDRLPPLFDIVVGNTCVLLDRDPDAAERRKVYGRAGEHRMPKHGIEYRTLSNFWLYNYKLMSMVFGLARLSCHIWATSLMDKDLPDPTRTYWVETVCPRWAADDKLLSLVKLEDVRDAINNNDLKLAQHNFKGLKKFLIAHVPDNSRAAYSSALSAGKIAPFEYFAEKIQEHGFSYWFPTDPMTHWLKMAAGTGSGWGGFESYMAGLTDPKTNKPVSMLI